MNPEPVARRTPNPLLLSLAAAACCSLGAFAAYAGAQWYWGKLARFVAARHSGNWDPYFDRFMVGDELLWLVVIPASLVIALVPTLIMKWAMGKPSRSGSRRLPRYALVLFALLVVSGYWVGKHNVMPGGTMHAFSAAIHGWQVANPTAARAFLSGPEAADHLRRSRRISPLWLLLLSLIVGPILGRQRGASSQQVRTSLRRTKLLP